MKKHLNWIDISKGITIVFMVAGHSSLPNLWQQWIFSFHMPFFFFISGVMTNWDYPVGLFIKRKTETLLKPFTIYSLINLVIYPFYSDDSWSGFVCNTLCNGWGSLALWFVPVLYVGLLLGRIVTNRFVLLATILFFILGAILSFYGIVLPWTLSSVPYACGFILIGRMARTWVIDRFPSFLSIAYRLTIGIVAFVSGLCCCQCFSQMDICNNKIMPLIPKLLIALFGIYFILVLSITLDSKKNYVEKVLAASGRYTFEILAFSQVIIMTINHNMVVNVVFKYIILIIILILICYTRKYTHIFSSRSSEA